MSRCVTCRAWISFACTCGGTTYAVGRHTAFASHIFCLVKYVKNEVVNALGDRSSVGRLTSALAIAADSCVAASTLVPRVRGPPPLRGVHSLDGTRGEAMRMASPIRRSTRPLGDAALLPSDGERSDRGVKGGPRGGVIVPGGGR